MNKHFKNSLLVLLTIFAFVGFFFACEQNEPESDFSNENPEFLQLSKDFNPSSPSASDLKILSIGFKRLPLMSVNGKTCLSETSATKLNMSEELFEIYSSLFNPYNTKQRKRRKEQGEQIFPNNNDCVPRSIAYSIDLLRQGQPSCYPSVQFYCQFHYGIKGVPLKNFNEVLNHFTINHPVSTTDLKMNDIVNIDPSTGFGHTAIVIAVKAGTVFFLNPFNTTQNRGQCELSKVIGGYRVTGYKNL